MLRSFFLALGISALILGAECLVIDKAVIHAKGNEMGGALPKPASYREIAPAEWAPWSLLSAGAVVMLYSFTLPAKIRG